MNERINFGAAPYRDFTYPRVIAPGAGGFWPGGAEAFRVEELPLYPFVGDGEHAALVVEKRGVTTRDVASGVARRLGVPPAAVGYAGMKDKDGVAVQRFTVTGVATEAAAVAFEAEGCRVLDASRHRNKLRLGHLAGNRFRLLLEGAAAEGARTALEQLAAQGVPNYYGPQRFGGRGDNAAMGFAVLQGRRRVGRWQRDLFVSALQSFLFNEVLARRVEEGTWDRPLEGDVLRKEDSGGLFRCEDPAVDGPRAAALEVSPTGPIPGRKAPQPAGAVAELEAAVLSDLGLAPALFDGETGSRRPLRVALGSWEAEEEAEGRLWITFSLPAGAFATSVVREVTGSDAPRG